MTEGLRVFQQGTVGRLTLDRPTALNALTLPMVRGIDAALTAWADDQRVGAILIDGAGTRGFCAGGDIRALYEAARDRQADVLERFFREEFTLNARLAGFGKPVVSLMAGLTMGGGIGLGAHLAHRIVTPTSRLAMPEVGIGYFPDVGGSHLLGTAPREFGTYAALTGAQLTASDAIACGLADYLIEAAEPDALAAQLDGCRSATDVDRILAELATDPGDATLRRSAGWIGRCFAGDSIAAIKAALTEAPEPEATAALRRIEAGCPFSLEVTLRALRAARRLGNLKACLDQELRIALRLTDRADFIEGVRAVVIDKDRRPSWRPARLEDVDAAEVAACFAPLGPGELGLAAGQETAA